MKEFIEKLIGRLEKQAEQYRRRGFEHEQKGYSAMADKYYGKQCSYLHSIEIVNELAEEYKATFMEELLEAKRNCGEDSYCSECPFGQVQDRCYLAELQIEGGNNGWIPCSERLPEANQKVLTCDKDGWISVNVNMPYIGVRNDFECGYYVAWMPLPAPYKE